MDPLGGEQHSFRGSLLIQFKIMLGFTSVTDVQSLLRHPDPPQTTFQSGPRHQRDGLWTHFDHICLPNRPSQSRLIEPLNSTSYSHESGIRRHHLHRATRMHDLQVNGCKALDAIDRIPTHQRLRSPFTFVEPILIHHDDPLDTESAKSAFIQDVKLPALVEQWKESGPAGVSSYTYNIRHPSVDDGAQVMPVVPAALILVGVQICLAEVPRLLIFRFRLDGAQLMPHERGHRCVGGPLGLLLRLLRARCGRTVYPSAPLHFPLIDQCRHPRGAEVLSTQDLRFFETSHRGESLIEGGDAVEVLRARQVGNLLEARNVKELCPHAEILSD